MLVGIDHLVVAVPDPDVATELLESALGVRSDGGGEHPQWGTRNRLIWLGDTYVELLGVTDAAVAAGSWLGGPAVDALRSGPGLISWAIASDDIEGDVAMFSAGGAKLASFTPGERRRPDGRVVRWRLALPRRISLAHPFLIEHDSTGAEWTSTERAVRAVSPGRLRAIDLPVDGVHGLPVGAHDHAVLIGIQRVVAMGTVGGTPRIHLTGLGPRRHFDLIGCAWTLE